MDDVIVVLGPDYVSDVLTETDFVGSSLLHSGSDGFSTAPEAFVDRLKDESKIANLSIICARISGYRWSKHRTRPG